MSEAVQLGGPAWLTQGPLAKLLAVLDRDGEEARVVGGAVRNALLGQPPGDIDVAKTKALIEKFMEFRCRLSAATGATCVGSIPSQLVKAS